MVTEKFSKIHCKIECSVQSTIKQPYGMIAIVKGKQKGLFTMAVLFITLEDWENGKGEGTWRK